MNNYIYQKGNHLVEVQEIGDDARIVGLRGFIDMIDLMYILLSNGYAIVK